MIKIYSQASHMKIGYNQATEEEIKTSENIILTTFRAEDTSLKRTWAVRKGLASPVQSFYIKDDDNPLKSKNLLPVGFLPWLLNYYKEANLEYEHVEMRKWPNIDKTFAKQLIDGNITCFKKSNTILEIDKYIDGDLLELQIDDDFYDFLQNNNFI